MDPLTQEQMKQRGAFQFRLLELNLISAGVLGSFALSNTDRYWDILLLYPFLSFLLFVFWLHHAFVIRLELLKPPPPPTGWQIARRQLFAVGILGSFVVLPCAGVWLHARGPERLPSEAMSTAGLVVFPVLVFAGFASWFVLQYHKSPEMASPSPPPPPRPDGTGGSRSSE